MSGLSSSDVFEETLAFPDDGAALRYSKLVGLDEVKTRLLKEAEVLLAPSVLARWSTAHHGGMIAAAEAFRERVPLFIFAGDVGTGKTVLAETFGDPIARDLGIEVLLFRLSLRARGAGSVGEMTQLISSAFDYVRAEIPAVDPGRDPSTAAVLLIDEADALAQSRELAQMHHEDRAGVNALIRGIDAVATERRPILTVMCTNRPGAIDPAIQRRAAEVVLFERPNLEQRQQILNEAFADAGLAAEEIAELAEMTGGSGEVPGYTYSDLKIRLIPSAILRAFPDQPLGFALIADVVRATPASPRFSEAAE